MGRFSRRSRSNRKKRAVPRVSILARLFYGAVALIPPIVLCGMGGKAFLQLADRILAQSAPLVSQEASRQLQRPVTVGKITPDISLGSLWEGLLHRESLGTLPVGVYDIRLLNRPGKETREAGGPLLAHVDSVTAFVSLPALIGGKTSSAVPRIVVTNPEVVLVRDAKGQFNVTNIVPKRENAPPSAPFQTFARLTGGKLRFRDYSALRPKPELPADNRFSNINGFADLLGSRTIRFQIQTNAAPNSSTARHLGGIVSAGGEVARGLPALRPNAPAPESARFLVHLYVGDADATYWVPYFVKTPDFKVTSGRGDLNLALVAPRPPKPGQPIPGIGVTLGANIRNVGLYSPKLPAPLEGAYGKFNYNDGTLDFDAQARILGEQVFTNGSMWDLTAPQKNAPLPKPQISVFLNAPRIPVERAVALLTPKDQPLPPGLHIGGVGSLTGTLSGPTANFVATGRISGLNVRQDGLPPVRNIAADLAYSGGLLGINNAVAFVEGGGQVRGRAGVRLAGLPITAKGNAVFAVQGSDINLASLSALKPLAKRPAKDKLRFSGRGNVEVVGQRTSGLITAAANVSAQNLRVGDLSFPIARARVLVSGNAVSVPAARIESPAGIVSVSGNLNGTKTLSARWAVASLDVGRVAQIAGIQNARGLVSAHGAIGGTIDTPRLFVDELVALNLRYEQATDQPKLTRRFAIDSVQGKNILVTPQSVTLARPLTVRRFPTTLMVGGNVSNLLPAKNQAANPRLNLYARLENLDFAEVQRQLAAADRARLREAARNLPRALAPTNTTDAPFGGLVKTANFRIVGTAKSPDVDGTIYLDRLFVGKYPIDNGSVLFSYNKNRVHVEKAKATASVGTITASGDLLANGTLRGQFAAPDLDLAKVSFLTGTTPLSGRLSLRGTASGTTQKPNVSVSIDPSNVSVSGFALQNVTAQNARYVGGPNNKPGRIELPLLSFEQSGAQVTLKDAVYNVQTGQVGGDFSAQTRDISTLISALRQSGLSDTDAGAAFTQGLSRLPSPLTGQFTLRTQVRGTLVDAANGQKRFTGDTGTFRFTGEGVQVGEFRADTINAVASLAGDTITLSELSAKTPSATIRGSGSYNIATSSGRALVETNEVSLDLVRSLPGLAAFPFYGTLSGATVSARMSRENGLSITASTEGKNLVYVPPAPSTGGTQTAAEAAVAAVLNAPPPGSPQAKALADATSPAQATQSAQAGQKSAATAQAVAANLPLRPGVTISSVRATVRLTQDAQKQATVSIDDFLLSRGAAELRVEGSLPLALNPDDPSVADRPISLRATIPQFAVANLLEEPLAEGTTPASGATNPNGAQPQAPKKRGNFLTNLFKKKSTTPALNVDDPKTALPQLGGTAEAMLSLTGTLNKPDLNGSLKIVDGQFRLPNPQNKNRDAISPISDLDADLVIANSRVSVNTLRAELGSVGGKKGGYGTLDIGGTVTLDDLANLQNLLRPAQTGDAKSAAALTLGGSLDLRAKFDNFRPEEENLLQLGEAASGKVNGTILVRGALRAPEVSAENNQPVRVTDALLRLTSSQEQTPPSTAPKPIDPKFDIPVLLDGKAVVTNPSLFRFEANGQATVAGRLSDPNVSAVITTQGGYFNLPTARFRVQKDGIVRLRYNLNDGSVRAENIIAKARVYSSASGASLSSYAQSGVSPETNGLPPSVTSTQSVSGTATAYTITATINGPLNLLSGTGNSGNVQNAEQVKLQFTSDPALSSTEIVALLGTQQQVDQARNGNVEGAFRGIAQQALLSSYVPQYLSPFTQGIQNSLGLADLTLDYNPNGAAGVYAAKAFNRFLLEYNQTIATRSTTGSTQKQPYTYSFSYDLFRLRPNSLIQPRVQIGTSTNEQHIQTYFLRGKLIF